MRVVGIALANFRLMVRDRSNLIAMIVVPVLFVFLIGAQFGGESAPTVTVARTGALADELTRQLDQDGTVTAARAPDPGAVRNAVGRGDAVLGVIVPTDAVERLAGRDPLEVEVVSRPDEGDDLRPVIDEALAEVTTAARVAAALADEPGAPALDEVTAAVAAADARLDRIEVTTAWAGDADHPGEGPGEGRGEGRFDEGAAQQLTLMTFMFTLFSAVPMAQTRGHGITHRMGSTPTPMRVVVIGEACGRWVVAVVQATYIAAASAVLFGVAWGDPLGVALTVAAFGAAGSGAGMLLGASLDDEGVLVGVGVVAALAVAAIGGAMLPTELMGDTLQAVSRFTPHAWAIEAFATLRRGGHVRDVAVELGVLAAMAAVLLTAAAWRLGAVLRRPRRPRRN